MVNLWIKEAYLAVENLTVDMFTINYAHIVIHQLQLQNGNARQLVVAKSIKVVALFVLIITARLKQNRNTLDISKKKILSKGLISFKITKLIAIRINLKLMVLVKLNKIKQIRYNLKKLKTYKM